MLHQCTEIDKYFDMCTLGSLVTNLDHESEAGGKCTENVLNISNGKIVKGELQELKNIHNLITKLD